MGLVDRVNASLSASSRGALRSRSDSPLSIDDYANFFNFGGLAYPVVQTTLGSVDRERVALSAVGAYKASGPIFALIVARLQVFSQVAFQFTRLTGSMPGDLFGTQDLNILEKPWAGGSTPRLLSVMEVDNSLAGNSYIVRARPDTLSRLRPEYVTIILGSETDAESPADAPDCTVAGYLYTPPSGVQKLYFPEEVAHYAPIPDPFYHFLGQSWVTPVIRELEGDTLATEHKTRFYANAATANMAIKFDPSLDIAKVKAFKELLEEEHQGAFNAWKTMYLGGGADPVPIGMNFRDMEYTAIQGKAESRLAAAAGVPPSWVGFSEGLQGSSLNAGNFNSARRRFSDGTVWHLWRAAASALESVVNVPAGANLWPDTRVPFMREDAGDQAAIQSQQASTIGSLIKDGFDPDSAVRAVINNDWSVLQHSGLVSVQMQPPGTPAGGGGGGGAGNGLPPKSGLAMKESGDSDPL
jgi:hypothetical protein